MPQAPHIVFVRPSTKLVKIRYILSVLVIAAGYFVSQYYPKIKGGVAIPAALFGIGALWLVATALRHLSLKFTSLSSDGEKLLHEAGFLSKSTRSMNLAKIQDARVDQSLGERMLGIGTLTLESAGESGRLVMENIDRPRAVADQILALSRQHLRGVGGTTV
jgi:uncharacterized membrane protein YdbT with pleckstrin-like domain